MENRFKFRLWDKANQRMILPQKFSEEFAIQLGGVIGVFENGTYHTVTSGVELMQWTGLKDRGGKEIFENDIIQDNVSRIWLVKYNKTLASFVFCWNKDLKQIQTYKRFNEYQRPLTILGDNFANPELLNGN